MQKERIARADYSLKCALCTVCIFYVTCMHMHLAQNDHSPGRLKFHDIFHDPRSTRIHLELCSSNIFSHNPSINIVMAAYRQVYDSHHLQADCQEPGSAPEPYAWVIEFGLPLPFTQYIINITAKMYKKGPQQPIKH